MPFIFGIAVESAILSLIIYFIDSDEFDYRKTFLVCLGLGIVTRILGAFLGLLALVPLVFLYYFAIRYAFSFDNKQAWKTTGIFFAVELVLGLALGMMFGG